MTFILLISLGLQPILKILFFKNEGAFFEDIASDLELTNVGWAWGTTFFEANNDGWLDLAATNGWNAHQGYSQDDSKIWIGNSQGTFTDMSSAYNFNDTLTANTLIAGDLDRDGDVDLVQGLNEPSTTIDLRVLRNEYKENGGELNYLVVQPRMIGQNKFAVGANVTIKIGERTQQRPILAGSSYYGQEPLEAFFGLGENETIDELIVTWPGGETTTVKNISGNQVLSITDSEALHKPAHLRISPESETHLVLSWGHMSTFENAFEVQKSANISFNNADSYYISSPQKLLLHEHASNEDVYYRVRAIAAELTSNWSEIVHYKRIEKLNAPSNFSARLVDSLEVFLQWEDVTSQEENFEIRRSTFASMYPYFKIDLPSNTSNFLDSNIEPSTNYYYGVLAKNSETESEMSSIVKIKSGGLLDELVLNLNENPVSDDSSFDIYPNPSQGQFQITDFQGPQGKVMMTIHSMSGESMRTWKTTGHRIESQIFNFSPVPGAYILEIVGTNYNASKKMSIR